MAITEKYAPTELENKWYQYWMENKLFHSEPDKREPFTIVIPPPNVTGVLHMGHILNNTIQDILARRARLQGKNVCWVPGTDHASIATEAKVVAKLAKEGVKKSDLTRDQFLEHAWEWTRKHGGIILEQLKKIGASCDWERTKFTLDNEMSESVIQFFLDLYEKGFIYRGVRMVNWDPSALTAVSDEEVTYKEEQSKLYYVRYRLVENQNQWITVATTRPETILGDVAVCVNPNDERYKHLQGKQVIVPLANRVVPIIADEYVDMEFGTGCLKITPAHDVNDYLIGQKFNLKTIDVFNDNGTMSDAAGRWIGHDRFEVRKLSVEQLRADGNLEKEENHVNKVGYSERTFVPIEPRLSMQWFVSMKKLCQPALDNVMNDNIRFHPPMFKNMYRHWMENVKDWNISRQLYWGQRIPAYYLPNSNDFVVASNIEKAVELARKKTGNPNLQASDLRQDEDVLDTWFSSALWPLSVFDGIRKPENKDIQYYYPTSTLVTAPEIIFFWVARMILSGYFYRDQKPFNDVYFTGIVRDGLGRKMSKSLGNSPEPLELIARYGADGVRLGMMLCSPAGTDIIFPIETDAATGEQIFPLCEQGRNFGNKIWNAYRLLNMWNVDEKAEQPQYAAAAIRWFEQALAHAANESARQFEQYRLSEALMTLYKLFWDEFAAWYLECVKPPYGQGIDRATYNATVAFFDQLMVLLHPFIPFITEEIWQNLHQRGANSSIMTAALPQFDQADAKMLESFEQVKEVIANVRRIRTEKQIERTAALELLIKSATPIQNGLFDSLIIKLCGLSAIRLVSDKVTGAASFIVKAIEYFVPVGDLIDKDAERKKLTEELNYTRGFLDSVAKKLSNEKFVQNAKPELVEKERQKQADAETKIRALEEQLAAL